MASYNTTSDGPSIDAQNVTLPCVPSQSFAWEELLPHAAAWDADKHFPVDTLRRAAELGFAGIYVRDDVGGCGPCSKPFVACSAP